MAKPTAQQCHALTTYFVNAIQSATGKSPVVNRNKARWGFESILMDFSPTQARELVDYYVKYWDIPSLEWFLYNYDKVAVSLDERKKEEESRVLRRKITQERLEQWRNRWQN